MTLRSSFKSSIADLGRFLFEDEDPAVADAHLHLLEHPTPWAPLQSTELHQSAVDTSKMSTKVLSRELAWLFTQVFLLAMLSALLCIIQIYARTTLFSWIAREVLTRNNDKWVAWQDISTRSKMVPHHSAWLLTGDIILAQLCCFVQPFLLVVVMFGWRAVHRMRLYVLLVVGSVIIILPAFLVTILNLDHIDASTVHMPLLLAYFVASVCLGLHVSEVTSERWFWVIFACFNGTLPFFFAIYDWGLTPFFLRLDGVGQSLCRVFLIPFIVNFCLCIGRALSYKLRVAPTNALVVLFFGFIPLFSFYGRFFLTHLTDLTASLLVNSALNLSGLLLRKVSLYVELVFYRAAGIPFKAAYALQESSRNRYMRCAYFIYEGITDLSLIVSTGAFFFFLDITADPLTDGSGSTSHLMTNLTIQVVTKLGGFICGIVLVHRRDVLGVWKTLFPHFILYSFIFHLITVLFLAQPLLDFLCPYFLTNDTVVFPYCFVIPQWE